MRLGLGPVFGYERLTASRRWQYYALRAFGLAALLVAMGSVAYSEDAFFGGRRSVSAYSRLGRSYFEAIITVELALVMLVAPATTAGAICLDRSRGTLEHLMTTGLSESEIILGKLVARLMPVLGLVACCLPVLALSSLLGGVDAVALASAFAVVVIVALVACSMALTLSIWARRPHEVVLAVYMTWAMAIVAYPIWEGMWRAEHWIEPPGWIMLANPFFVALSTRNPSMDRALIGLFFMAAALSSLLILLAGSRLRPAVIGGRPARRSEGPGWIARMTHHLPGPSLDGNPVLWREWHRARAPRLSLLLAMLVGGINIGSAARAWEIWHLGVTYRSISAWGYQGIYPYFVLVLFAGLVLAAVAPMSLAEERGRGSLDVLMTTPISTRAIVFGKWLSLYRMVPWLAIGPGLLGLGLAFGPPMLDRSRIGIEVGERLQACALIVAVILAHGALITSLGLALATWLRRESRAVGASITAFVLLAVVWPSLCLVLSESSRQRGDYLAIGGAVSPIYATTAIVSQLCMPDEWWGFKMEEIAGCTTGVAAFSILILMATVATFDRKMGRMPEHGSKPRRVPAPRAAGEGRASPDRIG